MEQIIDKLVIGISAFFRFDIENKPRQARKKSLIIMLIFVIALNVLAYMSIANIGR